MCINCVFIAFCKKIEVLHRFKAKKLKKTILRDRSSSANKLSLWKDATYKEKEKRFER